MSMENYESEYAAPNYSIVDKQIVGQKIITTVIIDNELVQFEADHQTVRAGKELET